MSPWAAPELERAAAHLAPYARGTVETAAFLAARLHAEHVSPEHHLAALLDDEECGATRLVLHAFADPETIGIEVRALCEGIMVVGSERSLPFSVLGVRALRDGRDRARGEERTVTPSDVFHSAASLLTGEARQRLVQLLGRSLDAVPTGADARSTSEPFFRSFAPATLRALGAACRAAASLRRESIGPVHLLLGCLETDDELRASTGLTASRLRAASSGHDADDTPLPPRPLPGDERIVELLARVPPAGETADVLGWILSHGTEELRALLRRQRITPALFERCRGAFPDPARPSAPA